MDKDKDKASRSPHGERGLKWSDFDLFRLGDVAPLRGSVD